VRRVVIGIVVGLTASLAISLASPVLAGGSWLRVDERLSVGAGNEPPGVWGGWAGVGAHVVMRGDVCLGQGDRPAEDGPWYVFLGPQNGEDVRTRVGTASWERIARAGCPFTFLARFTVPDVPAGPYIATVCDLTCTRYPGDLLGGFLRIAPTPQIARLRVLIARLSQDVRALRASADGRTQRIAELKAELEPLRDLHAQLTAQAAALQLVTSQRDVALGERDRAVATAAEETHASTWWRVIGSVAVIAWLLAGLLYLGRRRRTVRIRIPDTLEDLLEESPRDR
jgi:hypothetical protein